MTDEQWKELQRACALAVEHTSKATAAVAEAFAIVAGNLSNIVADVCDHYEVDSLEKLLQAIEKLKESGNLVDLADDLDEFAPAPKLPRPPKRIDPVNRPNYTANRPQRRARSSCRIYRR